jgi:hypothetical protein
MMKTVSTYETSISFYEITQRNILERLHLHTRRRENLKSHCRLLYSAFGESKLVSLMMEAVSTSETHVYFCEATRRHISEDLFSR